MTELEKAQTLNLLIEVGIPIIIQFGILLSLIRIGDILKDRIK